MKKKTILCIVIFLFAGNIFAQTGWQWMNPTAQSTKNYLSSFAVNSSTGWIGDNTGRLLKTTNAGVNWSVNFTDNAMEIYSIHFINSTSGWFCGTQGKIYKTTNGGANWNASISGVTNLLKAIYFVDGNSGFACGSSAVILKTTDSGLNWNSTSLPFPTVTLTSIRFFNSLTGLVYPSYNFTAGQFKTTNGGINWFTYSSNITGCNQQFFINESTGWLAGNVTNSSTIYRTTNGGLNWLNGGSLGFSMQSKCVSFINTLTGFASCVTGEIFKSTDGGGSWVLKSGNNHINNNSISAFDANNIFVTGNAESIFRSTDTGANWYLNYSYKFVNNMNDVKFINSQTGFFCGQQGRFARTTNGGVTFDTSSVGYQELFSVAIGNATTGWVSGSGVLKKTTNGGNTWLNQTPATFDSLFALYFYDLDTGWTGGMHGKFYKTTNGGDTWINQSFGTTEICKQIQFLNSQTGFFISQNKLFKTSNGGTNWSNINYDASGSLQRLQFLNEQTGWISALSMLYKTTNAGVNWQVTSVPNIVTFNFTSALTGYYTSYFSNSSEVYKSTNGGANWLQLFTTTESNFRAIYFTNDNTGWITGYYGHVLKTTNGGVTFAGHTSFEVPDKFSLKQNYPNPFNPSTKIIYEIKSSGFVSLMVFDLLGKHVTTLVNEKQTAGSYAVDFKSSEFYLPSGIYFYALNAGEFTETKKMILIK